jgi:hypothetical protein
MEPIIVPEPNATETDMSKMSTSELKDQIILSVRKQFQAKEARKYYNKAYGDLIKDEGERIDALLTTLEGLMEKARLNNIECNWVELNELRKMVAADADNTQDDNE